MPEKYLFDRNKLKNKLILRKILKNKMVWTLDALGKRGWNYQANSIIKKIQIGFWKEYSHLIRNELKLKIYNQVIKNII